MRALAIDFGTKKAGIAVSDALGISVRPVETVRLAGVGSLIARIRFLVEDLEAEAVVVGLPLRMDGSRGDAAEKVLRFVERLRREIPVPVATHDERLTSFEAERMLAERGVKKRSGQARVDEIAATIILQDYLSSIEAADSSGSE